MGLLLLVDIAVALAGLYLLKTLLGSKRSYNNLPPGPKPRPLIGNLLDLPKSYDWLHWAKHRALYGPISAISVFGQHIIVVNDAQIAFDLFEKKSSNYSDRPTLVFSGEMCGWKNTLALQRYGDRFRAYRKNIHQTMGTKSVLSKYFPHIETETRRFLLRCTQTPDKLVSHIRTMAGAIILKISHGYTIEPHGSDPLVDLATEALDQFSLSSQPGVWTVDVLPALRSLPDWVPGTGFLKTAERWHRTLDELAAKPHAFVKQQMANGTAFPSYTSQLLEKGPTQEEEFVIKWSAASLYSGGADTTVSSIHNFFLAMVLNPHVFKKAREEIDRVVGTDRLPNIDDRANLPYVDAVVKEMLRSKPVAPMGLPHVTLEDDVYMGYDIPKGALLLPNIWQMNHDPKYFHEPEVFRPERFLGVDGRAPEMDPHALTFGFGRRICPGRELADVSVYLAVVTSLAVFDISKVVDERGMVVEPVNECTTGVITHPKEFVLSLKARSPQALAMIKTVEEDAPFTDSDASALMGLKWSAQLAQ